MGGIDNDRERPGPELVRKGEESVGNVTRELDGLFDRIDQDRQRPILGAAFDLEDTFDRRQIEWIG